MRLTAVLAVIAAAVVLQAALARYTVGGLLVFDLVLVGVVYAAIQHGPAAGMLAGTVAGLSQDLLSGGVVGIGGLAKTVVGYVAGAVGGQFVLARPYVRAVLVAVGTWLHRMLVLAVLMAIEQQWMGFPWTATLIETGLNTLVALVAFQLTDSLPGMVERGRASRRSSLSRRQW